MAHIRIGDEIWGDSNCYCPNCGERAVWSRRANPAGEWHPHACWACGATFAITDVHVPLPGLQEEVVKTITAYETEWNADAKKAMEV